MNLEVLSFLIENEHYIEESANDANVDDYSKSLGIAKFLADKDGDLGALSKKQVYHYENVLKPLLENVPCEGPVGMINDEEGNWVSSCVHGGVIDDESLFLCYSEENFICQNCRHDVGKMV